MRKLNMPEKRLLVSVVSGLALSVALGLYLGREKKKISEHYTMGTVLRAKKYIGGGKSITADLVEEMEMPVAYLPPGAFTNKMEMVGANGAPRYKTRIGLMKGEPVLKSKLIETSALVGLAWTLQPGQAALSLKLSAPAAVSGLVQPGDWVNVISIIGDKSQLLLKRVRVGAVADQIWDPSSASQQNEFSKTVAGDGFLVTLILSPRETLATALAAEKGTLALILASPLETEPPSDESVSLKDVIQGRS